MKTPLTDTHAHLNFTRLEKEVEQIIKNAQKKGVVKIVCASSSIEDSKKAIELAKKYKQTVFASIGIHPQKTDPKNKDPLEKQIKNLEALAKTKIPVAIGECGLDFTTPPPGEIKRSQKDQVFLFEKQIEIAQKYDLPLIIHSRKSSSEVLEILKAKKLPLKGGVFHCYAGGKKKIKEIEKLGFYFGLAGNITYDKGLQNVFEKIPLNKILLETDSPYLSPAPKRGQTNTPENIRIIAQFLAKLKGKSIEEISKQTQKNVKRLFNI